MSLLASWFFFGLNRKKKTIFFGFFFRTEIASIRTEIAGVRIGIAGLSGLICKWFQRITN